MIRKPTFTDIIGIVAMLSIITLLIASIYDRERKESLTYNTIVVGQDTVKVNVYGEVIR